MSSYSQNVLRLLSFVQYKGAKTLDASAPKARNSSAQPNGLGLEFGENLGNHELNFRTIFSISHFAYQFLHKGFILAR